MTKQDNIEELLRRLPPDQFAFLKWQQEWVATARPNQIPPESGWNEHGWMAGRGFGKTRVGAEWLGRVSFECPDGLPRCVVAPTQNDVRYTCFEGVSGLLNVIPPECVKEYNKSDLILTLTNGATIRGFSAEKSARLRGPEHADAWCFTAGTMVSTVDGAQPIESLRPGDVVLTRKGARPVMANASREAEVGRVVFSNGEELVGTAEHPVYTSRGWVNLSQLREGDEVCAIDAWNGADTAGTAMAGGITSGARGRAGPTFTERSGKQSEDRSRPGITSTMSITTGSTTGSRTSSASRTASTASITAGRSSRGGTIRLSGPSSTCLARDAERPSSASGASANPFASDASSVERTPSATPLRKPARTADLLFARAPGLSAVSVASTWRPTGRRSVYCLRVAGEPEYFANGVLVHNCDEIAAWGKDAIDTLDMLKFGLRIGPGPRLVWTSTPKPVQIVRQLTTPKANRIVTVGATFDNVANLSDDFIDGLSEYEGTKIGRQELYGELIDPEEAGIVKRSDFNIWPANQPLPKFEWIVMSLDTAFTEKTLDSKGDPDPTACGVWGVFEQRDMGHVMLLHAWDEHLGFPDLLRKVKREMGMRYGDDQDEAIIKPLIGSAKPTTSGRKPDILLIEDKGSGISLRQSLERVNIMAHVYNPGRADKLSRLHAVSPIFAAKRVWLPESRKKPGRPMSWCEPVVSQLCSFAGERSIKHDDHVDQTSQAMRLMIDKNLLRVVKDRPAVQHHDASGPSRKRRVNPYGQ